MISSSRSSSFWSTSEDPERRMGLRVERLEQALELVRAVDRRDDEVERRKLAWRHGRTLGTPVPLVSVLLAVHNDARYLPPAVESVLRQTVADLELIVVDDASRPTRRRTLLAALADPRLACSRNEEQLGLAASLNRGLDRAPGATSRGSTPTTSRCPSGSSASSQRIALGPDVGVVGGGVLELDGEGRLGRAAPHARSGRAARPLALTLRRAVLPPDGRSSTASCSTARAALRPGLSARARTTTSGRVCSTYADGANLPEPLVLKRVHPEQASLRRSDVQRVVPAQVALREIARLAPELAADEAELAWRLGSGRRSRASSRAAAPYLALLERLRAPLRRRLREVRAAARASARCAPGCAPRRSRSAPRYPARLAAASVEAAHRKHAARRGSAAALGLAAPTRAGARSASRWSLPEPTPYRSPLFDRVARSPEIDLTVIYAARDRRRTARGRSSREHRGGVPPRRQRFPGSPGCCTTTIRSHRESRARSRDARPDVVVVSGWSTFAVAGGDRLVSRAGSPVRARSSRATTSAAPGWRRAVKGDGRAARSCASAAGALVSARARASRSSPAARDPERVRVFANTIDVAAWEERADELARTTRRSSGPSSARRTTTSSFSRSPGSVRRRGSTRSSAPSAETRRRAPLLVVAGERPRARPRSRSSPREPASAAPDRRSLRGGGRRDVRRRRRLRAALERETGGWSSTRPRPRACRSCSQTESAPRTTCCATARTACSSLRATSRRRPLRSRGSPPTSDSASGRASGRASSSGSGATSLRSRASSPPCARRRRAIDLFLRGSHAGPTTCVSRPRRLPAASRSRRPLSPRDLPDGADHRCPVVGHDEGLAVLEEPGDAAAVRDDDRRPRCGRFSGDHPEALARRGEHEDVRLRDTGRAAAARHRQGVDPAARRVSDCARRSASPTP